MGKRWALHSSITNQRNTHQQRAEQQLEVRVSRPPPAGHHQVSQPSTPPHLGPSSLSFMHLPFLPYTYRQTSRHPHVLYKGNRFQFDTHINGLKRMKVKKAVGKHERILFCFVLPLILKFRSAIKGDKAGELSMTQGDVQTEVVDGISSISFSGKVHAMREKSMNRTMVIKLLGRKIGYNALINKIYALKKSIMNIKNESYFAKFQDVNGFMKALAKGPQVVFG
ncbi:hypothetical protein Goari_024486 [Gossypium aridum]|uniref:Uncharacterized protein n=1 Tax=Gossypium aridum TaxID=34290 RepID=A0A7J8X6B6_GOSAI|nr:hypothetical protein [Gossypium aridum]